VATPASAIIGDTMTYVYCISKGPDVGDVLDSIESLEAFARSHGPAATTWTSTPLSRSLGQRSRLGRGAS
jgi:hypothetical protein